MTLVPLGLGSWAAFLYAGSAAHVSRWRVWGAIYLVLVAAGWAGALAAPDESIAATSAFVLLIGVWVGSVVHALVIRGPYLEQTFDETHPSVDRDLGGKAVCIYRASGRALLLHPDLGSHEVRVYDSRGSSLFWGTFFALLALFSLGGIIADPTAVWAWALLVIFGGCAWLFLADLVRPVPSLVVGPRGIGMVYQEILWDDVTAVDHYQQLVKGGTIDWLTVFTGRDPYPQEAVDEDLRHVLHARSRVARFLTRVLGAAIGGMRSANKLMAGGADVQINIDGLPITPEDVLLLVGRFFPPQSSPHPRRTLMAATRKQTRAARRKRRRKGRQQPAVDGHDALQADDKDGKE